MPKLMLCSFHLYLLYVSLYPSTFWKVVFKSAKSYSFCFSKEERYRTYIGMVTIFIFLFQSSVFWTPYYHLRRLLQEHRVSFFNFWCHFWCHIHHSWCHPLLLECHSLSFGCHFRCHIDCHFGVHSKFWDSCYRTCFH